MSQKFLHESTYRGTAALARLGEPLVVVCGAGALGSHLVDNLARQGYQKLRVIDHDRVEEHNVSTQLYGIADVGAWKVDCLRNRVFRAAEVELDAVNKELTERNVASLLKGADVVLDLFDNAASRRLVQDHCRARPTPCLHVGLNADYFEAIWDQRYRVPQDVAGDVCEYPLARNLILLAVAVASEVLTRYLLQGEQRDYSGTLGDFAIREYEG